MLSLELILEASKRQGSEQACRILLDDASMQSAYCLDAPSEVQDGMEWWQDPELDDVNGAVPRVVKLRE